MLKSCVVIYDRDGDFCIFIGPEVEAVRVADSMHKTLDRRIGIEVVPFEPNSQRKAA